MYNELMDGKGNANQSGSEPYEVECHAVWESPSTRRGAPGVRA